MHLKIVGTKTEYSSQMTQLPATLGQFLKAILKNITPYKHKCVTVKAAAPISYTEGSFTFF